MAERPVKILIVEDDLVFARRFKMNLELEGWEAQIANGAQEALGTLASEYFDLAILDIIMPGMDGIELLTLIRSGHQGIDADIPILILTSVDAIATAVEAMKLGAYDFIAKVSEKEEIIMRVRKVLEQTRLINENRWLRDQLERWSEFQEIVGVSPAITNIKKEITRAAPTDVPVLLTGETGVGKELVARAIHRTSPFAQGPFVDVNCASLPRDNLLQSDLFGYEKGAFTGALQSHRGKFEQAQGGTLFLDEISELSPDTQANLLKAIETLEISRLGGEKKIKIRCRLVFATNRDLAQEVEQKHFRRDLYFRITVFPLHIPPLRDRAEDIPVLVQFFLEQYARKYSKSILQVSPEAMQLLEKYEWPGNVRELKNIVERLVIKLDKKTTEPEDLKLCGFTPSEAALSPITIPETGLNLDELERQLVVKALEKASWNQKEAARLLGISIDRMHSRVKKYGLRHPSWRVHKE